VVWVETGLRDKVVLITGAASGIGRATAISFAREHASLALIDIDGAGLSRLAQELGHDVQVATSIRDLSTRTGVESGIAESLRPYGGVVDVLVNNVGAGVWRVFDDLADEDWDKTFQLNFFSYVRAIRAVLPAMRAARRGVIVNNASDLARQPEANPLDYSVSKAAVLSLTKALSRSEGPNIRINAVAPGPIWTPLWTKPGGLAETLGKVHKMPPDKAVEHEMSLRQLPLKRLGTAEEVANVIVFRSSDLASFVTGSTYGVDGGSIRSI
jgi:NAD(P)-dependent dehydrogenase (short-subunit alcohol dehydrogenase family)